ncbi:MAG: hypothetical protein HQ592_03305, partial [Planctomycetes bacterium]|nr:hypothetical protein [Planctomycetota bacterium]
LFPMLKASLKSLAWPNVYFPPAALLSLSLLAVLGIQFLVKKEARDCRTLLLLSLGGLAVLNAVSIGVFRGENNNFGMPSFRYTDLLLGLPLVVLLAGLRTIELAERKNAQTVLRLLTALAFLVFAGGYTIHSLYRIWPFVARENGEWRGGAAHAALKESLRAGESAVADRMYDQDSPYHPPSDEWAGARESDGILRSGLLFGIELECATGGATAGEREEDGFRPAGYFPALQPPAHLTFLGSYGPQEEGEERRFVSESFVCHGPALEFGLLLDKKARFRKYQLPGCTLDLVRESTGERRELLSRLLYGYPSLLRDREEISVPVVPGEAYRIEAADTDPVAWFAFSEPRDAGRLSPVMVALFNSSKLFALAGAGLFMLVWVIGKIMPMDENESVPR